MDKEQVKKTFRGKVIATRSFTYEKDEAEHTAGELVLALPGTGDKGYITLFGDARCHVDGWWLNAETWEYEAGPTIEVGQWVMGHGSYSEKDWESDKFGVVTQRKIAVFAPEDVKRIAAPVRPTHLAPDAKPSRPAAV